MAVTVQDLVVDVDADDRDAAVAWWSAALGGDPRPVDATRTRVDVVRSRVGLLVRTAGGADPGYHLDLASDDDGEAGRLVAAGATVRDDGQEAVVLTDPVGLSFRLVDGGTRDGLSDARDSLHLRVVMLDVPRTGAATAAAFWATALGGEPLPVGDHYPDYTWIRPAHGPGGPINVCVQATDGTAPRMHVDLHCPDVDARDRHVARLVDLGGRVLDERAHWVVLRAPGGHLACVVPDAP